MARRSAALLGNISAIVPLTDGFVLSQQTLWRHISDVCRLVSVYDTAWPPWLCSVTHLGHSAYCDVMWRCWVIQRNVTSCDAVDSFGVLWLHATWLGRSAYCDVMWRLTQGVTQADPPLISQDVTQSLPPPRTRIDVKIIFIDTT